MDNEQERNEHFKGFADLLFTEICKLPGIHIETDRPEQEEAIPRLIAQYAYDLAVHVLAHQLATDHYNRWPALSAQEALQDGSIPDLTGWPKTASESLEPDE